ncbi:MFS transporter [Roseibium litorale]|uniref:MFS transporter n=1 Tax=Roseibium litorale TaxID=2803841 RepID=A0ABR9CR46_9HYPH|nr:MFS transporter [Roseibium litorale]MBD8893299.1 MFS transporter [Roseibium litorale]
MSGRRFGVAGAAALVVGHFSGMIDLIALPVWVGALVERYGFSPQQAGILVTLFLLGAVAASTVAAPRLNSMNGRAFSAGGFFVAAAAFFAAAGQTVFTPLAGLHLLAGASVGTALSMVHGTMAHTANPHRLYAMAGIALGLFAIILLAAIPQLLIAFGGQSLFFVFAGVMTVAAVTCALFFPHAEPVQDHKKQPFSRAVWFTILAISIMTFNQAMVFSFVEVIGKSRGFSAEHVLAVLIALGFVNFVLPSPLAAILQNRISATLVTQIGPLLQIVLAIIITSATAFPVWAPSAAVFVSVQIFTHTFAFGHLTKLDPTGRAAAATPAMLMIGAALGPSAGGALGQNFGYPSLGIAAVFVGLASIFFFTKGKHA